MEFIENKSFFIGILTGLLWTGFGIMMLLFFLSDLTLEESLSHLYHQKKLGGLISLAALINLPVFFISLRKNNFAFATGILVFSLLVVILIALLKLYPLT